jgi:hypothetical protein
MNNEEGDGCATVIVIAAIVLFIFSAIVAGIKEGHGKEITNLEIRVEMAKRETNNLRDEAVSLGFAKYNEKTGVWEWIKKEAVE